MPRFPMVVCGSKRRFHVLGKPLHEQLLPIGRGEGEGGVVASLPMFNAPTVILAEGVIGPIPTVLLEQIDAIAKVVCGARCPTNGTELTKEDVDIVTALEIDHRLERSAQGNFVIVLAADAAGIAYSRGISLDALMRE